jgi:SOS response associated peptidase (SRAP)
MDRFLDRHVRTIQTNDFRRGACSPLSYPDSTRTGSADQLEHRSDTGCPCDPVQPRIETTHLGHFAVGPDSELGQSSKFAYKTINARGETIDSAPSCRQAFKKRRCLVPTDGFFEWKKVPGGKIPYSISMKDDSPFVFAGLWEGWKDPANDEWLHTCTIITGEPNEFVREIHTRMPVMLPESTTRHGYLVKSERILHPISGGPKEGGGQSVLV